MLLIDISFMHADPEEVRQNLMLLVNSMCMEAVKQSPEHCRVLMEAGVMLSATALQDALVLEGKLPAEFGHGG